MDVLKLYLLFLFYIIRRKELHKLYLNYIMSILKGYLRLSLSSFLFYFYCKNISFGKKLMLCRDVNYFKHFKYIVFC